jgi:hypothetical protein
MAQRFKAKTLLSNSGVFNNEVIAPNLVYNTGNQTIGGLKTFSNGVISSVGVTGTNLIYNTGNQTISGVKTFSEISSLKNPTLSGDVINKKYADENLVQYIDRTLSFNTNLDLSFPTGLSGIKKINYTLRQASGFTWGVNYNNITWLTSAPPNPTTGSPVVFEYYPLGPNSTQSYGMYMNAIADLEKNRSTIVYTTGNQSISGNKTLNDSIFLNSGLVFLRLGGGNEDVDIDLLSRPFSNTRVSIGTETGLLGQSINTSNFEREIKIWETGGFGGFYGPFVRIGRSGVLISEKTESKVGIGTLFPTEKVHISGGNLRVENNLQVSGTGIFNAIDLNSIDNLTLSGVDITITSGVVTLTNAPILSGNPLITGNLSLYATTANLALTGSTLQTNINNLSGTSVQTFGNQTITGNKTFLGNIVINNLTVTGTESIVNTSNVNIGSNFLLLNVTGGGGVHGPASDGGIFFITGSGFTGINDTGAIIGYDSPTNKWVFGLAARSSDLANLNEIASVSLVTALSGRAVFTNGNQTISGTKIFAGSLGLGDINNPNSNKLYFYDTGTAAYNTIQTYSDAFSSYTIFELSDQGSTSKISIDLVSKTISGANNSAINFSNRPTVNGTGVLLSGEAAQVDLSTTVRTTGNQIVSGIKSFATGIDIINSGNPQNLRVFNRTGTNTGEFGIFSWNNNQLIIGSQQTNSGILRDVILTGANININASGVLNIFDPVNITGNVTITGHLSASSKSFLINHPTQLGKKLQYGSLEGPEHGVFVRGKTSDTTINLPDYWASLVDEDSISVNLTPIDVFSNIYVVEYNNRRIVTDGNNGNYYFYTVYGERKDIPKLTVEF